MEARYCLCLLVFLTALQEIVSQQGKLNILSIWIFNKSWLVFHWTNSFYRYPWLLCIKFNLKVPCGFSQKWQLSRCLCAYVIVMLHGLKQCIFSVSFRRNCCLPNVEIAHARCFRMRSLEASQSTIRSLFYVAKYAALRPIYFQRIVRQQFCNLIYIANLAELKIVIF